MATFNVLRLTFHDSSRLRMGAAVDLAQARGVQVRVLLRRRERGVSEKLLNRPQIGSGREKVGGEGVAQRVGRDLGWKAGSAKAPFQEARHRARGQPPSPRVDEQGLS